MCVTVSAILPAPARRPGDSVNLNHACVKTYIIVLLLCGRALLSQEKDLVFVFRITVFINGTCTSIF